MSEKTTAQIINEIELYGEELKHELLHNFKTFALLESKKNYPPVSKFYEGIASFIDAISLVSLHLKAPEKK